MTEGKLMMIDFENVIEPGVSLNGNLKLVGDSMLSGSVSGDVICIGKGAILYLSPQSSVGGRVIGDVVVAAGVVGGCINAKTSLYAVDGCAVGETLCEGEKGGGPSPDLFIKSHLIVRQKDIDEDAIVEYAVHQHCAHLYAGKAVIFEDGHQKQNAGSGFFGKLKINILKS